MKSLSGDVFSTCDPRHPSSATARCRVWGVYSSDCTAPQGTIRVHISGLGKDQNSKSEVRSYQMRITFTPSLSRKIISQTTELYVGAGRWCSQQVHPAPRCLHRPLPSPGRSSDSQGDLSSTQGQATALLKTQHRLPIRLRMKLSKIGAAVNLRGSDPTPCLPPRRQLFPSLAPTPMAFSNVPPSRSLVSASTKPPLTMPSFFTT